VDEPAAAGPQNGYEYLVKDGDNLGLIIKAFKEKGVKVTKSQIIAANPKMNPNVLIPGKKIFIPDANAK
jgi:Tfp pilus assembly protein FimV